jgi:hypothetical protein
MIRLRRFAASARQVRAGGFSASARQVRAGAFAASARQVISIVLALMTVGSTSVLACPVCFGAEETSTIDATRLGILVLLGVTVAVQGAFVAFFLYLRRRAKRIADVDLETEWSELQGASRTS